jgi:hypothetical protein
MRMAALRDRESQAVSGPVGLCLRCAHARQVESARGSRFVLCELARTDDHFPRYPPLPVLSCRGYRENGGRANRAGKSTP